MLLKITFLQSTLRKEVVIFSLCRGPTGAFNHPRRDPGQWQEFKDILGLRITQTNPSNHLCPPTASLADICLLAIYQRWAVAIKGLTPQGYCPSISTIKLDSGAASCALRRRPVSNGHPGAPCCPFLSTVQRHRHSPTHNWHMGLLSVLPSFFKGEDLYGDL